MEKQQVMASMQEKQCTNGHSAKRIRFVIEMYNPPGSRLAGSRSKTAEICHVEKAVQGTSFMTGDCTDE